MSGFVVDRRKSELIGAALLAGVGGYFLVAGMRLPPPDEPGVPGAGTVPIILGAVIILCAISVAWTAAKTARDQSLDLGGTKQGIALLSLIIGTALFEPAGFMLSTFLFLSAGFVLLGEASWQRALPAAALVSGALWLLFTKLLGVGLPYGLIGEILFR